MSALQNFIIYFLALILEWNEVKDLYEKDNEIC